MDCSLLWHIIMHLHKNSCSGQDLLTKTISKLPLSGQKNVDSSLQKWVILWIFFQKVIFIEPKDEGQIMISLILALGPDCGVSYIGIYGRCIEKHNKTQQVHIVWLLRKKCLQKMKESTSGSRLTTDFSTWVIDGLKILWSNEAGPTDFRWWDCTYIANTSTNRSLSYASWRKGTTCWWKKKKSFANLL